MFHLGHSAGLQSLVRLLYISVVSLLLSQMLEVQNTEFKKWGLDSVTGTSCLKLAAIICSLGI